MNKKRRIFHKSQKNVQGVVSPFPLPVYSVMYEYLIGILRLT